MIFAVVLTVVYVIYYAVMVVHDLYGKPKEKNSDAETFDVSDMEDGDESVSVDESDGGFSVGGNEYGTSFETPTADEERQDGRQGARVDAAERMLADMDGKLEDIKPCFSDPMYEEELRRTMIARGFRGSRPRVRATSIKDEI